MIYYWWTDQDGAKVVHNSWSPEIRSFESDRMAEAYIGARTWGYGVVHTKDYASSFAQPVLF